MTPTEVLIAARELCEEKWGQSLSGNGLPTDCECASTAIGNCSHHHDTWVGALRFFVAAIGGGELGDPFLARRVIWPWNDHPSRTLADVLAAFDRAIEMSREAM